MAKKKKKSLKAGAIIFPIVFLLLGFVIGQFFHFPVFDDMNFLDAARRPPSQHIRR